MAQPFVNSPLESLICRPLVYPFPRSALVASATGCYVWKNLARPLKSVMESLQRTKQEVAELTTAWKIHPEDVTLTGRLDGDTPGAFGEVHRGTYLGHDVAVKKLRRLMIDLDPTQTEMFEREIEFMRSIRHPHIVLFYGAGLDEAGIPFLVTELLSVGSLRGLLSDASVGLAWPLRVQFAAHAAKGMKFLHALRPPRLHRDLKAANLLVSDKWVVKVADFGTSTLYDLKGSRDRSSGSSSVGLAVNCDEPDFPEPGHETVNLLVTETQGTLAFMAPECHTERKFGPSSDVYSFAIVLWEIVTRLEEPFSHIRVGVTGVGRCRSRWNASQELTR